MLTLASAFYDCAHEFKSVQTSFAFFHPFCMLEVSPQPSLARWSSRREILRDVSNFPSDGHSHCFCLSLSWSLVSERVVGHSGSDPFQGSKWSYVKVPTMSPPLLARPLVFSLQCSSVSLCKFSQSWRELGTPPHSSWLCPHVEAPGNPSPQPTHLRPIKPLTLCFLIPLRNPKPVSLDRNKINVISIAIT